MSSKTEPRKLPQVLGLLVAALELRMRIVPPRHALKTWALNAYLERALEIGLVDVEELVDHLVELASSPFVQRITELMKRSPEKLNRLSGQRRRTFILSYLEGLSDEEAADCCSLTVRDYRYQKRCLLESLA